MLTTPGSRVGRLGLRVRLRFTRHPITGHRVRCLRWKFELGADCGDRGRWTLGAWDRDATMWTGWTWPA